MSKGFGTACRRFLGSANSAFQLVSLAAAASLFTSLAMAQSAPVPPPTKTAEQAFKNIQILKTIPSDQLIPTMQFISASLGVECEYCHVAHAFDKDDKKPKQTARKMMQMMFAINDGHFEGHREVTCYSCHHGNSHPVSIPVISTEASPAAHLEPMKPAADKIADKAPDNTNDKSADAADAPADIKTVIDPILDKYVAALGGAAAIQKVTSRVEKGSADVGGRTFPVDIYAQAPGRRVSIMHLPNGDSVTAFNGTAGWLGMPGRPVQWMSQAETDAYRLDADLQLPLRLKEIFPSFHVLPPQKINGSDASIVQGIREGKPPVNFYFDQRTGLLVRMVRYTDTALGLNPAQIDYADYRDSSGVKIPYRWTIARPGGQFTIQLEQVQPNAPIEEDRFAAPPPQALEPKPPNQ